MRIRASSSAGMALAFALAVGAVGPARAASTVVAYNFSGTLASFTGLNGAAVGDVITGSFAYDSSQVGSLSTGLYTFTGSSKVHTFSFKIFDSSGAQIFTDSYTNDSTVATGGLYTAQVAYSSTAGTTLNLEGDTITKYDGGFGSTGVAFHLTLFDPSNAGPTGGYGKPNNLVLPTSSMYGGDFGLTTGILSWDPSNLSFTTSNLILTQVGTPEPSALVLAVLGLSICAAGSLFARRRQIAPARSNRPPSTS